MNSPRREPWGETRATFSSPGGATDSMPPVQLIGLICRPSGAGGTCFPFPTADAVGYSLSPPCGSDKATSWLEFRSIQSSANKTIAQVFPGLMKPKSCDWTTRRNFGKFSTGHGNPSPTGRESVTMSSGIAYSRRQRIKHPRRLESVCPLMEDFRRCDVLLSPHSP